MKGRYWITAAVVALATMGVVSAADLGNLSGQSCGDATGTWHFVNNQTGGEQTPGTLEVCFTSGCQTVTASTVLNNTQHFFVIASGALISAETNLPGRLVLSDFSCDVKEPPPCDPKTDPNQCK
jgi:hypothetical protein